MIFNEEFETLPRPALEALQLKRLQDVTKRVYERVPFYKKKFDEAHIKPGDVKSLKDLQKLPFTVKQDLRDNYPFGLFTLPMEDIVRIHASSGTTGKPTVVGYTKKDIELWAELMARTLSVGRGHEERYHPQCLWVRAFYRRIGHSLRLGAAGRFRHPDIRRQHEAPDHDHAGFRIHDPRLYPLVCLVYRRGCRGGGRRLSRT